MHKIFSSMRGFEFRYFNLSSPYNFGFGCCTFGLGKGEPDCIQDDDLGDGYDDLYGYGDGDGSCFSEMLFIGEANA